MDHLTVGRVVVNPPNGRTACSLPSTTCGPTRVGPSWGRQLTVAVHLLAVSARRRFGVLGPDDRARLLSCCRG